jgi:hypothetical protein
MVCDPSKVLICSPRIFLTENWITTLQEYYGDRSVVYIHEAQQDAIDPRKDARFPLVTVQIPSFLSFEESDPDVFKKVEETIQTSSEQWVVILGRHTERLRALHRSLVEKIDDDVSARTCKHPRTYSYCKE